MYILQIFMYIHTCDMHSSFQLSITMSLHSNLAIGIFII